MNQSYMKVSAIVLICMLIGSSAFLLTSFRSIDLLSIQGRDMEPTLHKGDQILVTKEIEELRRGDIVIFNYPGNPSKTFIKRIIGLPNEVIEIREGKVLIGGLYLNEEYVDPRLNIFPHDAIPKQIPTGNYYVMGDNRDNSNDSRAWGALPQEFLQGKILFHF